MGARGPKPGTPRIGGRKKGQIGERRKVFLAKIEEQFREKEYDPIAEMIALAQKEILTVQDMMFLDIHKILAKKHFPDVTAVTVSGNPDSPLVVQTLEARLNDGIRLRNEARNGHASTVTNSN